MKNTYVRQGNSLSSSLIIIAGMQPPNDTLQILFPHFFSVFTIPMKLAILVLAVFLLQNPPHCTSFTPLDNYLINCGSNEYTTLVDNREFVGDIGSTHLSKTPSSSQLTNPHPGINALYNTARLFSAAAGYSFPVCKTGYHFVRLHFSPFQDQNFDLASANFSVLINGHLSFRSFNELMYNSDTSSTFGLVKEYILSVVEDDRKIEILFVPVGESDVAYVNAVEVFSAPGDLILEYGARSVGPAGIEEYQYNDTSFRILETLFRINVGGSKLTSFNDTLWRTWENDEVYLSLKSAARSVNTSHTPNYQGGGASREVAPDNVYMTAREMNRDNLSDARFNISWKFYTAEGGQGHLVRLHFCDIVSMTLNQLYFNVYVNGLIGYRDLDLSAQTFQMLASPYYIDLVVESDDKGAIRVSVGPSDLSSTLNVNAILNGVEIMKIMTSPTKSLLPKNKTNRRNIWIILVGLLLCGLALILLLLVLVTMLKHGKKKQTPRRVASTVGWTPLRVQGGSSHSRMSMRTNLTSPVQNGYFAVKIPFVDIQTATNNFDSRLIVGSGGFGTVFKGVLSDNTPVAVKRGVRGNWQGLPEFQTEIAILTKICHHHLVTLVGYCEEQSEMLLVYEYMENGPLKKHLYGGSCEPLSWKRRLDICIGAARGLHYLHTGSARGIIHRDVKSTNILLDSNYVAKVADFGLSRSGPCVDETHVSTGVKGSFGYLDPEYFRRQQLTDKSDVYSFGVVLLEVVCARPAVNPSLPREQVNLAEWAMQWQKKGLLHQIIDPHLDGQIKPASLKKFGDTAEKCLADNGVDRPTMGDVLWNLEYALQLQETSSTETTQVISTPGTSTSQEAPPSSSQAPESDDTDRLEISTTKVFSQLLNNNGR